MDNVTVECINWFKGTIVEDLWCGGQTLNEDYIKSSRSIMTPPPPKPEGAEVVAVECSRYPSREDAAIRLAEIAASRGLLMLGGRVYRTARCWFCYCVEG